MDASAAYGALLSMIEIGLGSLLHAIQAPFAGFILSLNQGFILSRVVKNHRLDSRDKLLPLHVSNVASLLKSLSPAGERLAPMVAISMQGLLFNVGTVVLGRNLIGVSLGMVFLCLWAYVQIFLYYYFIFGKQLAEVLEFYFQEIRSIVAIDVTHVVLVIVAVIILKVILGIILGVTAFILPERHFKKYQENILKSYTTPKNIQVEQSFSKAFKGSARDLLRAPFLLTLVMMAVFFAVTGSSWQGVVTGLMRPLAVGFLLFFTIRILPVGKILPYLEKTRFKNLSKSVAKAFQLVRKE